VHIRLHFPFARYPAAIRSPKSLVALAAPVLTQAIKEASDPLETGFLPYHQQGRSAPGTFHMSLIGRFNRKV
jgi:hypothetical protein